MLDWNPQPPYTAEQLLQVIRILRDPENGCPWDKVRPMRPSAKTFWKRPARRWRPLTQMTPFCSERNWETC